MARTISHAVIGMKPGVKAEIKRAFHATGCMDLYGGRLEEYLTVIAQNLERKNMRVEELELRLSKLKKTSLLHSDTERR